MTASSQQIVLARHTPVTWARARPQPWLWAPFGVALVMSVLIAIAARQPWALLGAPGFTVLFWFGQLVVAFRPTAGSAEADASGVRWSGRWGSYAYAWPQVEWIELARDQPGARVFNELSPQSNVRTGARIGVAVVVDTVPHYIHPLWSTSDSARIDFGCGLAALARSAGVRVRVLQGDWGAENANREPSQP